MTKKQGHQKFWEIDDIFGEKCRNVFGKRLKKVVQNFRQKFGSPVSEVLDPQVLLPQLPLWLNVF